MNQTAETVVQQAGPMRGKRLTIVVLALVFALSCGATASAWFLYRMYQTLPTLDQLENIEPPLSSKVLGRDGTLIHEFSIEKRSWVPLAEIPQHLVNAVIAIEDRKYYSHWGVDLKRIIGAMFVNIRRRHAAQGASTITQQLARNVYLSSKTSMIRKVREAMTAIQIEQFYTKRQILELYLNQVYLGAGVYGMEAASQCYFSKHVSKLTLNECAVLAGIIQLPERYRPDRPSNLKNTLARRDQVLKSMVSMRFLDNASAAGVMKEGLPSNPKSDVSERAPYFVEMVRKYCEQKYGDDLLYNGGLTIYTTLDPAAQDSIDKAKVPHLDTLQRKMNAYFLDRSNICRKLKIKRDFFIKHFDSVYAANKTACEALPDSLRLRIVQTALVAMDVKTGAILSLLGGRNFLESKFNRAVQSVRQPGSAFKPIVYTAAIDHGFTPASVVLDQPITLMTPQGEWRPENFDGKFRGPVTVRTALEHSLNLVAIQVLLQVTGDTVVNYARRMGLKQRMEPVPSLAVGSCEVMPMELLDAYAIFPNKGVRVEPYYVERVIDKNGNVLEEHQTMSTKVLSPQTAYMMCDLLQGVVRRGTGAAIPGMGFPRPSGGKTGTSNDYSDAWFVGFTPQIACAVWVGMDERRSFGYGVTGALGAIPLYVKAMIALHRNIKPENFEKPDSIVSLKICPVSHKVATPYCPQPYDECFIEGTQPGDCDMHGPGKVKNADMMNMFGPKEKAQEKVPPKKRLMF
ncbi:MAG TPA: PBP1A family penicillin-binding protein [Chitinivibrionales bacterium]|nr:PBP1A family penicillin-binding protein [Chitinivibrionales bacterium]